jgi:seryl-tRNA synthetase
VARLHRALAQFMLDVQTAEHGYTECYTPYIVNREVLEGTGPAAQVQGRHVLGQAGRRREAQPEQYLISTSEISLTNTVREQILDAAQLPIKLTAHSPCFRSEAGSAGRDTRGMIRQHQFDKVEMVQIVHPSTATRRWSRWSATPRPSCSAGTALPRGAAVHRRHGLRRRQDLRPRGLAAGAEHLPRDQLVQNCEAFQARRMQARFKRAGQAELVHTLNGSGLAVGRTLVAVLENHQQADGSI